MTSATSGPAPASEKLNALLDDLEQRLAGLPPVEPAGPGVHDMNVPMTTPELTRWLILRVARPEDLGGYLLQYAGRTRAEMDEIYDAQHGSMA